VNGSGAKPWNQKGTGRARAGYKSSPIWSGGGVVFGPHPRSYAKKVSKKTRRIALCKALSARILAGDVFIVPSFAVAKPKTKEFIKLIAELSPEPKTLIISKDFDENTRLAARNVQPAVLASASDVNSEHLLLFKKIVITSDALAQLAERINK
jgi:large subunit ribosomal protein L4